MLLSKEDELTISIDPECCEYQVVIHVAHITDLIETGAEITGVLLDENVIMGRDKNYAVRIDTVVGEYDIKVNTVTTADNKVYFTESLDAETCGLKPNDLCVLVEVVRRPLVRQSADRLAACQ